MQRSCLALLALVMLANAASAAPSEREAQIARAKKTLAELHKKGTSYQALVKSVPDYGINSDTWTWDGESSEGILQFQLPGKYHFNWGPNSDIYCDGTEVKIWNGGSQINTLRLDELPIWMFMSGEIGTTVKVDAVTQQSGRINNNKITATALDLSPIGSGHGTGKIRIYFSNEKDGHLLGWRVPAEGRSGYNPNFIHFWLQDLHPENLDSNFCQAPPAK